MLCVLGLGVLSPEGRQDLHLVPNSDSQLQSFFKQHEQPEVLGLGDVLPLGGLLDLYHGAVHAVWEESRKTRQEVLSASSSEKLSKEVKINMLTQNCGPSEKILLHNDAALLGIDFVKEIAVENPVGDSVSVVMDLDLHEQVPELSALSGGLSGEFRKLFDIKQKLLFALQSMLESSPDFFISSAFEMSATAVPSTPLKGRVSSTFSSLTSSTTSPRASVLDQNSAPVFSRDGILGKAGESLTFQQLGKKSSVIVNEIVF